MRPCLILLGCLLLLGQSQAILLCNGDCVDSTELEICQALPKNETQLNIMAFFPCNSPVFRARGLTVAAQMAVREIGRSSLLPGYSLKLLVENTMCDQLAAIRAFINQLDTMQQTGDQRYMIIGPGCSVGAALTAQVAPFYSLTQIGYTTTSVSLSDQKLFPNFLRVISSDIASVETMTALVKVFGWRQVAIVSFRDFLFTNLTSGQISALTRNNIRVLSEQFAYSDSSSEVLEDLVDRLNRSGARVVLLNVYEADARQLYCMAYQRGMIYPHYTFIGQYWWSEFWWTDGVNETNCTTQELTDAIFRSLAIDNFPTPLAEERDNETDVHLTPNSFWAEFERNLQNLSYPRSEALRQAAFVYDAVWMAAMALNNASIELQNGAVENASSLAQFNHFVNPALSSKINDLILGAARETEFRGVSGVVKLNSFGDREPTRTVYQFPYRDVIDPNAVNTSLMPFASVDNSGQLVFFPGHSINTVFPGGPTADVQEITINVALFSVYTSLAILGVGFAVVCILFNLVFRNKRIVKLSSPYLNILIIVGAIFFYIAAIMLGLDHPFTPREVVDILHCQFSVWLVSVGFSLLFGTMLVKTWRVYYIFKNIRLKKRPLKDWLLFLMVMVMVGVDIVFMIIVSVDLFRVRLTEQPLVPQSDGELPHYIELCRSSASDIWILILLVYKGLYLIVGVFLAVQTYNVKLKRLRDSKLIVACVCTVCVAALVGSIVGLAVTEPTTAYGVYGFFILLVVTAILFILFGTLMIELYKNPSGEVEVSTVAGGSDNLDTIKTSTDDQVKINQLKQAIQTLKDEIEVKKRLTLEFTGSENVDSPSHSGAGSKTNLIRDSVTPSHVTGHVIDSANHDQSEGVVVNNGASVVSPDHVELQEQDQPESHSVSVTVHVGLKSESTKL